MLIAQSMIACMGLQESNFSVHEMGKDSDQRPARLSEPTEGMIMIFDISLLSLYQIVVTAIDFGSLAQPDGDCTAGFQGYTPGRMMFRTAHSMYNDAGSAGHCPQTPEAAGFGHCG